MGNRPGASNTVPQGRCYYTNRDLTEVNFLDPCNSGFDQSPSIDRGYCTTGTDVDILEVGVVIGGVVTVAVVIGGVIVEGSSLNKCFKNH